MCDLTWVTIGLTAVSIAGTAAGTALSIQASQQQGKFQKDMMRYQADMDKQRASLAMKNAEIQSGRLAEQRRLAAAAGMAEFAASGQLIDGAATSAPNIWEQDMAAETAWQQEELRTQAMYEAWGFRANADMLTAQGRMAQRGATMESWGTALSGLGRVAELAGKGIERYKSLSGPGNPDSLLANYAGSAGTHGTRFAATV